MEHSDRHIRFWGLLAFISKILVKLKLNFKGKMNDIPGPCLVLSNHTTDWDPLMIGSTFKRHMYFVATESVNRMGFASKLIKFFISPIIRQKGGNAAGTVKSILRCLKAGHSVCLFPEGNRSWDGETGEFPASTAKLAKTGGATLVTYKITGGYFSSPRWAGKTLRKGKTSGEVTGIYTPEQLKTMSLDDITELIRKGIYENAYKTQITAPVEYKGKNRARNIENLLFACPNCHKLHLIKSNGNTLRCEACGASADYLETGFLKGNFVYDNLIDWHGWQKELINELCETEENSVVFEDSGIELDEVCSGKEAKPIAVGKVRLFPGRIELPGGLCLPGKDIGGMAVQQDAKMFIGTAEGKIYQIRSERPFCCLKYLLASRKLGFIDSFV